MKCEEMHLKFKRNAGLVYLEVLLALSLIGIVSISLLPFVPKMISSSKLLKTRTELVSLAETAGNYIFFWVDSDIKTRPLSSYSNGERINDNLMVKPLMKNILDGVEPDNISDKYKVSIQVFETTFRKISAKTKITVWLDENDNNFLEKTEQSFVLNTIITE
jgi:hypothetical protein